MSWSKTKNKNGQWSKVLANFVKNTVSIFKKVAKWPKKVAKWPFLKCKMASKKR